MAKQKYTLQDILFPKTVAVIGASRNLSKAGTIILKNLLNHGFKGKIYPVNPKTEEILGLKTYKEIGEIPEKVDVAVVAVKAEKVPKIMEECVKKGVKGTVIISSGFAEEGRKDLEEEILKIAKKEGLRIIGPNTTGVYNTENNFITSFVQLIKSGKGDIAFIAQTGLFLGFQLEHLLTHEKLKLSKVIGLGNKCDIDDAEALNYLRKDKQTKVVAIYLEGLKDGRKFLEEAKKTSASKPIIILKSGITPEGSKVALSHTGSLTGKKEVFNAACKQAGLIQVETFTEMTTLLKSFSKLPLPKGNKLAVMSVTGAGCVLAADYVSSTNLKITPLSKKTVTHLQSKSPNWHKVKNPVDMWPILEKIGIEEGYKEILYSLYRDKKVDNILIVFGDMKKLEASISNVKPPWKNKPKKPIVATLTGYRSKVERTKEELEKQGIPVYHDIRDSVFALSKLYQYKKYKEKNKESAKREK